MEHVFVAAGCAMLLVRFVEFQYALFAGPFMRLALVMPKPYTRLLPKLQKIELAIVLLPTVVLPEVLPWSVSLRMWFLRSC